MARQVIKFKERDTYGRELILLSVPELKDIFPLPEKEDKHFALFLAMDGRKEVIGDLGEIPRKLIDQGLAYLCAWGDDCERVHDIFDEVSEFVEKETGKENTIMTAWHSDESLEDALWFALYCTTPVDHFEETCKTTFFVSVSNPTWADDIKDALLNIT